MNEEVRKIEEKWQKYWEEHHTFEVKNEGANPYYILVEFPYPSGAGLHVGHVRSYTAHDAMARMKRMQGDNVLFPMGFDAFGAPAEQYAIKNHIHPKEATKVNIDNFKKQMKKLGFSFDWNREFSTTDPEYYKWTQWQFLQFYKNGMAYKDKIPVNWCPNCKIVLSNEDAAGGVCERCGTQVEQKEKSQWMLKMSSYAEDLLTGLEDTNFADKVKLGQINWIGKSSGVEVDVNIVGGGKFSIFTTCIETIYGVTFFVLAPDGKLVKELMPRIKNQEEVQNYINETAKKSNMDRTELNKGKSGCILEGITAINPVNGKEVPVFIGDFVLGSYGTGAVMAVPSHDQRDFEYAKTHNIEMIQTITGESTISKAYEKHDYLENKESVLINSEEFDGLSVMSAKEAITKKLEDAKVARRVNNYKMRDWIFSRQRFWGEPIPMVECPECGYVPLDEKDLPLLLPDVAEYEPTDDGESPLAKITDWVNCKCPKCGKDAKRETDTMPQWAGSSWYFLRFMDAHNDKEFASMDAMKYWNKVNWYNGGMEHTARHLLYARFWVQMLYNLGLVPNKEMIWTRVSHGMILGSNNEKMSKSKGNVINPDDIVNEFGADTLRVYELFIGDYQMDASWSTDSLKGCNRFLKRIEKMGEKLVDSNKITNEVLANKTIKKIISDLNNLKFNTAVSSLMIMLNEYEKQENVTKADYRLLLQLLNPMAPHITEELNERYNLGPAICESKFPVCDEAKIIEDKITMAVQVNGKLRGNINVNPEDEEEIIKKKAFEVENVAKFIEEKEIVKVIVVPKKIVSIVVK